MITVTEMCAGRVLVYGGRNAKGQPLSSVEMLSADNHTWLTQPTSMFVADFFFSSVPLSA
jgi:hypothetical protein